MSITHYNILFDWTVLKSRHHSDVVILSDTNFFVFPRLLSSGSLVVIAPTVEDTALYECVVSNEAGEDSRFINLTVHGMKHRIY